MPQIERNEPGSFAWVELATSDQDAAKSFYAPLFGWQFSDSPMGPGDFYTVFTLEDRKAAAAYTLRGDEAAMGIPPHWALYVSVANADATAKRASECGGSVLAGPFDVSTHGRMAVVRDPTGAVFCLWEPHTHPGLGIKDQNGSFCWADLSTPDPQRAAAFYADVFGWSMPPGQGGYLHIANGANFIGGIQPAEHREASLPPHWLIYFHVDDCDFSTQKARELGGKIYMGPMTMEKVGRMTVLADPQGAVFSLFQPLPPQ
jgi:predicted enzyme related to lactoylglutathione lyase